MSSITQRPNSQLYNSSNNVNQRSSKYRVKNQKKFSQKKKIVTADHFYSQHMKDLPSVGFMDLDSQRVDYVKGVLDEEIVACAFEEGEEAYVKSLPDFRFRVRDLMLRIKDYLGRGGVQVYLGGSRLVGSVAQCVLKGESVTVSDLNDLDLSFYITGGDQHEIGTVISFAVQQMVSSFIADRCSYVSYEDIANYYIRDFVTIQNTNDSWSLCSLGNSDFSVDIKFIYKMNRRYSFSLNSFEIIVDDLLSNYKVSRVPVETTYGHYESALHHLNSGIIHTHNPEEIFRGCFRFALQLAKGHHIYSEEEASLYEAFNRNFQSTFGWGNVSNFRRSLLRFIDHHKKEKSNILFYLEKVISYNPAFQRKDCFLEITRELKNM
eukprot:TRINITY_DN13097_c0_g1_i1.p1 TRINITY_DN13097_c0_g1~~TRINITY_DN13097_c0_g1_i1.p1  ORF type:complete len:405 (+),score=63.12 TRINITY_DN13097_c0_g1_i1:82-1215(+)